MTVQSFGGQGGPSPEILLWAGLVGDIPPGWVLCDGNNGTPNLTNKMLRGNSSMGGSVGTVGGQNTKSLSTSQIPSHGHNGTLNDVGSHQHNYSAGSGGGGDDTFDEPVRNGVFTRSTSTDGSHAHNINVSSTGSGSGIENRPQHLQVGYIMKL